MKNLKLLALSFILGASSLFATNLDKVLENEIKPPPPVNSLVADSNITLQKETVITLQEETVLNIDLIYKKSGEIAVLGSDTDSNLKQIQGKLNYGVSKKQAAINYSYNLKSVIIAKE